jgi:hypothetical protein
LAALVALVAAGAGCKPDLGNPASLVTSLRFLAIQETPAEAAPGSMVSYTSLLVDGTGERPDLAGQIDWAFCSQPKPLSELGDVTYLCYQKSAAYLTEVGIGATVSGALPSDACSFFGPDAPPAMMGMVAGRPADPDPSGGYYQPVRLILQPNGAAGTPALVLGAGESRIICGLPGASSDTLAKFRMAYKPNENPEILGVDAKWGTSNDVMLMPDGKGANPSVPPGTPVTLTASWPDCQLPPPPAPCVPMSCPGAECYARYDQATQMVSTQTETVTVSWFATAGTFATDRSKPDSGDNTWTTPSTPTAGVAMWVVLHDDRGGVSWQSYHLDVSSQ